MESRHEQLRRRRYPRRRFQRGVGFLYKGHYYIGQGYEIGEGGLAFIPKIKTSEDLREGEMIVLSFQIPGGSFISALAEIRNVLKKNGTFHYGCLFRGLKFEAKREVRTFVTARASNE